MAKNIFDEVGSLQKCALDLLVGEQLGSGSTRRVYALKHNPDLVVKLEFSARQFCNVSEYEIWNEVRDTPRVAKFLAPVIAIDVWAGALIMKRTQPITAEEFKAEIRSLPQFMSDIHWANFGRLDGQIVCHDYGYHNGYDGLRTSKLTRVKHD